MTDIDDGLILGRNHADASHWIIDANNGPSKKTILTILIIVGIVLGVGVLRATKTTNWLSTHNRIHTNSGSK